MRVIRHAFLFGGNLHLLTLWSLLCLSRFLFFRTRPQTLTSYFLLLHITLRSVLLKFDFPSQNHTFTRTRQIPNTTQR